MFETMERIKELILGYLREELSTDEQRELDIWLAEAPRNNELLTEIQNADSLAASFAKLDRLDRVGVWERVKAYSEEQKAVPFQERTDHIGRFRMLRWAAAAVVLAILGTGTWWVVRQQHITQPDQVSTTKAALHDVLPGSTKAVLTLSSGRQVTLDSSMEDTVMTEGAAIVASAKGKLAYNPGTDANLSVTYNTLTTPRGGQYQLTLPDGSRVWLNAGSSITYPTAFVGQERKVSITGEAYFEVSKNVSQPFKVAIKDLEEVEVLGTGFDINAYDDEQTIKTTLLDGSVRVLAGTSPSVGVNTTSDKLSVVLKPGQQAHLAVAVNTNSGSKEQIKVLSGVDIAGVVAWKNGLFAFTDADLPTVMRQLARWYNVEVTYEGNIPKREFNGKIGKTLTLDQVLKVLTKTRVHYTIEEKKLTIRP